MAIALSAVSPKTFLRLGRVSNLPTVLTNVLAATVVCGGNPSDWRMALVMLAAVLFYVGGMYLNDWFDREVDARERGSRPIPSGAIASQTVLWIGIVLLVLAVLLLALITGTALAAGLGLAALIVAYDAFHKNNPVAPVLMGGCRAMVYVIAAVACDGNAHALVVPALAMVAYVAGLTYAARQEHFNAVGNLWPLAVLLFPLGVAAQALTHGLTGIGVAALFAGATALAVYWLAGRQTPAAVPNAVSLLIAGISLLDAALLASAGAPSMALAAIAGFWLTLLLQRIVPGT